MAGKYSTKTVEILKLHAAGMKMSVIARTVGCSRGNVSIVLLREANKCAECQRAYERRLQIKADGDLDREWPVLVLRNALQLGGQADYVLRCFFAQQGVESCSLRGLLDIMLPWPQNSVTSHGDIPITLTKGGGRRIHAKMVAALASVDLGSTFKAEYLRRFEFWQHVSAKRLTQSGIPRESPVLW